MRMRYQGCYQAIEAWGPCSMEDPGELAAAANTFVEVSTIESLATSHHASSPQLSRRCLGRSLRGQR